MKCKICPNPNKICWCTLHPGNKLVDGLSVQKMKLAVAKAFKITQHDLESKSRNKIIVNARQIAMYIARNETSLSLAEIGNAFNRYHATVIYSVETVRNDREMISQAKYCMQLLSIT